jgi:sugar phosphate permease
VAQPTRVRYAVLGVATLNAFLLYLDRVCMGAVVQSESFQREMAMDKGRVGDVLASFFFAYALGQVPAGFLADRFGPRRMLVTYILAWSVCTAATGFATSAAALVMIRMACGFAEAGAYPASGLVISRWFPYRQRARANSTVSFGGRVGNAMALWLTAAAIAAWGAWRPVLWLYGGAGVLLALATYRIFRDFPAEHPGVNAAERAEIGDAPVAPAARAARFPWKELLMHRGLWFLNFGMMGLNLAWAFLITWLPAYLREVHQLDSVSASRYVSLALTAGLGGMLFGGWWCDFLTARFGPVLGRRLPFVIGGSVTAVAYLACPMVGSPLAVAALCALVAFAADSIMPAVWAVGQDVGPGNVASTMAWSNMWGNFGASAVAKVIPLVIASQLHSADWREVFVLCAAGAALLAVCSLGIDVSRKIPS